MSITVTSATVSLQSSIDNINWEDIADSTFTVTTFGLQSYSEGQQELLYRLKCSAQPTASQILI